jgi:hypothetical protein
MRLDHLHPLAHGEEIDLKDGSRETVLNSWGTASLFTETLEEQGAHGRAAEVIAGALANAGHPEADTEALIHQVLAATDDSQAHLRVLQQRIAEALAHAGEQVFGQEGHR